MVILLYLQTKQLLMQDFSSKIQIKIDHSVYLKDPETSALGINILKGSIELIDELGFENFNFKKLAIHIKSTEASVYRYFESKHQLLVYLASWYWGWMEYRLLFGLANIESPASRLEKAVRILSGNVQVDKSIEHINEVKLNAIVTREFSKIYLNIKVDEDNKEGYFAPYKTVVQKASDIVLEINPNFKYPHMLISTMIEGAHHQRFFAEHLPRLTDTIKGEDAVTEFYVDMVFKTLTSK